MTQQQPPGRWRLLFPAALVWIATATAIGFPGLSLHLVVITVVCTCLTVICLMVPSIRHRTRSFINVFGMTLGLLGMTMASVHLTEHARQDPVLVTAAETRAILTLNVTIDGFEDYHERADGNGEARYRVPAHTETSSGTVALMLWGEGEIPHDLVPGSSAIVRGSITVAEPARAEGYSVNVVDIEHVTRTRVFEAYANVLTSLREELVTVSSRTSMAELVPGFAVGDTTLVSDELDAAMKETSLTHLIAVSGANCALITGFVIAVGGRFGMTRHPRIVLAAITLTGFVLLVGPDASIQRAAIMAAVTLVSQFGGKTSAGYPALGIAILLLLFLDPWQARQPGFTLSVSATWGIMLFTPWIEQQLTEKCRVPHWLALTVAVTVAAQFACGPLLLLLQDGLPVGGLLANVLAAPAAPVGTGLGLAAMLCIHIHEGLGNMVTLLAGFASGWVIWIAETLSVVPGMRWHWPGGSVGAILLTLSQGCIVAAVLLRRGIWDMGPERMWPKSQPWQETPVVPRAVRRMFAVLIALGVGLFISVVLTIPLTDRLRTPTDWEIVMCDVGQGDAFLVRSMNAPDEIMLTDTGDDPELLRACLNRFGVSQISLLVLSHDDRDHVGALQEVLSMTKRAVISPETTDTEAREVMEALDSAGIPTSTGHAGITGGLVSSGESHHGLAWRILAPAQGISASNNNDASIVMEIDTGHLRVLMLGDTGETGHTQLLRKYPELSVDVVKVAHHGSQDQDPALLLQLDATYALVSSGAGNRYGHPHQTVLDTLTMSETNVLRSDERGSVAIRVMDGSVNVWTER